MLVLTIIVAGLRLSGLSTTGPSTTSFFAQVGWIASNIVPLVLVSVGLVGHSLRERSAGYAFAAGLVANASLMGGYAVGVVSNGRVLDSAHRIWLIQLGTIGATAWAIVWLASRRWVVAWREGPETPWGRPLMVLQLALAGGGNMLLLIPAVVQLLLKHPMPKDLIQIGNSGGWLALVPAVATIVWYVGRSAPRFAIHIGASSGLLLGILLACAVGRWDNSGWSGAPYLDGNLELAWSGTVNSWLGRRVLACSRARLLDSGEERTSSTIRVGGVSRSREPKMG